MTQMSNKETKARVANAFRAMKDIGIHEAKVKQVLKDLLKLYDRNWAYIEEENYRVLADAIFERDEAEALERSKKKVDSEAAEHSKKIVKNKKKGYLEEEAHEAEEEPERPLKRLRLKYRDGQSSSGLNAPKSSVLEMLLGTPKEEPNELPEPRPPNLSDGTSKGIQPSSPSRPMRLRDRGKGSVSPQIPSREKSQVSQSLSFAAWLKEPNTEPSIVRTPSPERNNVASHALIKPKDEPITDDMPQFAVPIVVIPPDPSNGGNSSSRSGTISEHSVSLTVNANESTNGTAAPNEPNSKKELAMITGPCIGSSNDSVDSQIGVEATLPNNTLLLPPCAVDGSHLEKMNGGDDQLGTNVENRDNCAEKMNLSLVVYKQPYVVDITNGQEKVVITLVNEVNDENPPSFYYIPKNAVSKDAHVNFSLARIGDKNCCPTCSGDCLSLSELCACARESGGEFAYTHHGLIKEELLEECISTNHDPKKHGQFFCKECPLERSKGEDNVEPCKGHLTRKFIKECWWKCGCDMQCGNRVVQRGIACNLQVFMTPEGKGWGLRTLSDLPKGAFVCEYVGEILTSSEFYARVLLCPKGVKRSYPVLLDAGWGVSGVLKDEEALCLDATGYGNVARFINHRCYDSNLVEIPVEVETPDHHYYHVAFFTTRHVKALEELTRDYGIDFDDNDHPIKVFHCRCGSKFCRDIKRLRTRPARG